MAILLGIASAISWGIGDFAGGLAARRTGALIALLTAATIGGVLLFVGFLLAGEQGMSLTSILFSIAAGVMGITGLLILYHAMSIGQISIVAPLSALLAASLPVGVGVFLEGFPGWAILAGFLLAFVAIGLISRMDHDQPREQTRVAALQLALISGFGFGLYFVLMNRASQDFVWTPLFIARLTGVLTLLLVLLVRRQKFQVQQNTWHLLVINGFFDAGGNTLYVLAGQFGRMDVSAVLASLYPGMTVLLAWLILKERIAPIQKLGIGLALAAIVLFTV